MGPARALSNRVESGLAGSDEAETERRQRGPYAQGLVTQNRILSEASDLFGRRGYRGASLDEIAKAVGMTKQGLLHHYPNKQALMTAVLEYRDEVDLDGWPDREGLVGLAMLDAWDRVVERNCDLIGLVRLSHVLCAEASGNAEHPGREFFLHHFAIGHDLLVRAFRAGVDAGQLRPDLDYAVVSHQVIGMLEGLENQWLVDPAAVDIVGLFHDYTQQLRSHIIRR